MWKVSCPLIPGIMEVVLLMSWEGQPHGNGRYLGKKLGSASARWAVAVNMTGVADLAEEQGGKESLLRSPHPLLPRAPPGTPVLD